MSQPALYKIVPHAVDDDFIAVLYGIREQCGLSHISSVYGEPNSDGTEDNRYADPCEKIPGKQWRHHEGTLLDHDVVHQLLQPIVCKHIDGVYRAVDPYLQDVFLSSLKTHDHIDNHVDPPISVWNPRSHIRRANFAIILGDDYTGGEMIINGVTIPKPSAGDLVLYPQPQPHAIMPVTSGERFVAFGWIYDAAIPNHIGLNFTNK